MVQPLYFEPDVQFEKLGSEVMLPDDPNAWSEELMQELYKQVPFLADFQPQVVLDRVEGEKGYAFGHCEVSNKSEIQHGVEPAAASAAGVKNARIPIIVKDFRLQPLDLLVTDDQKVLPLTEPRLRQAIFRPQAFDITGRGPGDMSMIGQLYPPYRQNYGFGGGGATMNVGMGKEGGVKEALNASTLGSYLKKQTDPAALAGASRSMLGRGAQMAAEGSPKAQKYLAGGTIAAQRATKLSSVLSAILPTIREYDYNSFFAKLADRGLQAQYIANHGATAAALDTLSKYEPVSPVKLAEASLRNIKPSVVQLRKEAEGYTLKTASYACWLPVERALDRGEALRLLGPKVVLAADQTGSTTMSLGDGSSEETAQSPGGEAEQVTEYGIYQVQDEKGNRLIGFVFPNLIDIDGKPLPIALFTNGSQMAVQSDIAGIPVGEGVSLFEGHPEGMGVFYKDSQATLPLTVKATMASPEEGGVILHAETFDGREAQVMVQPNIEQPTPGPDGEFLIPDSWSWLPLDTCEKTALISTPEDMGKEGEALRSLTAVTMRCGGDCFSVDGFAVEKLASEDKQFLSLDETVFLLAGLGANLDYAQKKLGEAAAFHRPASVVVNREIKTASSALLESRKEAMRVLSDMPDLRRDLVKEAAVIPDPAAVDTVLSLGFLNPENLGIFVSSLPELDVAQSKLCELLLASRLGLRDVPGPALEKAIHALEETIEGLKILAFSGSR